MENIYLNYSSSIEESRNIYFIIDLRELKITKIFKDTKYLETLEPSSHLMCYKCPIYRGNLVYISDAHGISFKSLANQILENIKNRSKAAEVEWIPYFGIDKTTVEVIMS